MIVAENRVKIILGKVALFTVRLCPHTFLEINNLTAVAMNVFHTLLCTSDDN